MGLVNVFDRFEDLTSIGVKMLEDNLEARKHINHIYRQKLMDYKETTGWADRFRQRQEELKKKGDLYDIIDPHLVHMSEDEYNKFHKTIPDIGEGYELSCAVQLTSFDGKYNFQAGIIRPDCLEYINQNDFSNFEDLTKGIKSYVEQSKPQFFGANIKPFIYTVKKEEDFSEEEKQNMRSLMDDPSQIEEPGMDEEEKSLMKQLIEGLSGMFEGGPIRGLNELEVAEFEAAWNKL
ncbi:hypothetical protein COV93_05980 [Candidatus Woesearchaeota archaeon CG11_big_fil_rev_8_21_14_0_20_43_8]|nr:MAG: hypothetical protein COV93_05980 [Candidatus Woesearchaeota archaeon CG11_big_fil_rev_8_21_14_0_20_43_8]PIO08859.1 MAG: hypothetical protein COT47_00865 [Candidatus Woesearchaeota archaeon CG08_land_8_20_14_0_20_43_7]